MKLLITTNIANNIKTVINNYKPIMKKTTIKAAVLTAAVAVALVGCKKGDDKQAAGAQQQAPAIEVLTIEPSTSELANSFPAVLRGKTDIDIRPQVSGFITKVCVDEGQAVKKGQTLFIIDQVQYQAAVSQAKAAVNSARAAVNTAKSQEANQRMLFDKGIISQTQWQTAADQLAQAQAGLAQAQANLTSAQKNLSFTVVTAPSNGVVGSIPFREGSLASPSMAQPLTTVSDVSEVYAYFSLTELDILKMTNNGEISLAQALAQLPAVQLRLANGDVYRHTGKVATISGTNDNATGSASVRALFPNDNGVLRSGATGQIVIPNVNNSALLVPQKATFEIQDKKFVLVLGDSSKLHSTPIEILDINDGQNYVVTAGLEPGQTIAVEGVGNLVRDGSVIQPVTAEQKAAMQQQGAKK